MGNVFRLGKEFRLAYNDGFQYVDLFPKTNIDSIEGKNKLLKYTTVTVDIPVTSDTTQSIPVTLTPTQLTAPFYMELLTNTPQGSADYSTIDQVEVKDNMLVITRLSNMPTGQIQVKLTFKENEE